MSAFNMTPISILDKSPMGGFRGGLADDRAIQHSNSNLLTESLAQDRQREDLETIRLNRPTDAIKRAAEEAKLEEEMQMRKEGYFREKANLEQESRMQDLIKQKDTNELNRVNREGEAMVRASQQLEAAGENAQNMLYLTANWDAITDPLKQSGMKNIPPPSVEAAQKIMKNSQAWIRSSKFIQEEMMSRQKHLQDIDRDLIKAGAESGYRTAENIRHEVWQGGQNDAQRRTMVRVAEIGADGRSSGATNEKKQIGEAQAAVKAWLADPTNPDKEPDIFTKMQALAPYEEKARKAALLAVKSDTGIALLSQKAEITTDPTVKKQLEAQLEAKIQQKFQSVYSTDKDLAAVRQAIAAAEAKSPSKQAVTKTTPQPTTPERDMRRPSEIAAEQPGLVDKILSSLLPTPQAGRGQQTTQETSTAPTATQGTKQKFTTSNGQVVYKIMAPDGTITWENDKGQKVTVK